MKEIDGKILIEQGVGPWNQCRNEHPEILPNLSNIELSGRNLSGIDLSDTDLQNADLSNADLSRANLKGANLHHANLKNATLSDASIDEFTDFQTIKGCRIGHNGFLSPGTHTVALVQHFGPGQAYQSGSAEAVVQIFQRARRLHGTSLTLAGIFLLIAVLGLEEIEYQNIAISPVNFGLFAMPISIALVALVNTLLSDALTGMRFTNDKDAVMLVGMFPWSLVKHTRNGIINKWLSFCTRFVMAFHPLVYIHYWNYIEANLFYMTIFLLIVLSVLSTWSFILAQTFQKPIFFLNESDQLPLQRADHNQTAQAGA